MASDTERPASELDRFARAVLAGTIVGSLPVGLTVPSAVLHLFGSGGGAKGLLGALTIAVSPILISFPLVLLSNAVIGLPLSRLLRASGARSMRALSVCGAVVGLVVSLVLLGLANASVSMVWVGCIGALSGFASGRAWASDDHVSEGRSAGRRP